MKKLLISSALAAIVSTAAFAITNNYQATATFNASINFVDTITISVGDFSIIDAVGGDTVNKTTDITVLKDADRVAECTSSNGDDFVSFVNPADAADNFNLGISSLTCGAITLAGNLPVNATNNVTYNGSLSILAAYTTASHE